MIQFNLLPDVKLEFLKAQRQRRLVVSISAIVTVLAVALLVLLLSFDGLQKKHLNDLNNDVSSESSKLQNEPNINGILTVQNQLESLTALHDGKPATTRLFSYLNQITPSAVSIDSFDIDFTQDTMSISGNANSLSDVNKFVDTLKFTTYTVAGNSTPAPAFSNVVLSGFGSGGTTGQTTYNISLTYDKNIFDTTQNVTLAVPNLTTTRASLNQSTDLFQASIAPTNGGSK